MTQAEAEANKWRCPDCGEPLEESRGIYYCPPCTLKGVLNGNKAT